MRKLVAILFLGLGLALYGVGIYAVPSYADETTKPLIKCDTCGTSFTSQAGLTDHLKTYPQHRAVAPVEPKEAKPLIKCDTCGTSFTSQAGLADHLKAHPDHKAAAPEATKPLIKCSTCGVEFTTIKDRKEHMKAHPEHKIVTE